CPRRAGGGGRAAVVSSFSCSLRGPGWGVAGRVLPLGRWGVARAVRRGCGVTADRSELSPPASAGGGRAPAPRGGGGGPAARVARAGRGGGRGAGGERGGSRGSSRRAPPRLRQVRWPVEQR